MARRSSAQLREEKRGQEARTRTIKTSGIGGLLAVGFVVLPVSLWPEPATGDTSAEGWDLPGLEGEGRVALSGFHGKPTVAAFLASWCTGCEQDIPQLVALSQQLGDEVDFAGINSQDNGRGLGDARKRGIVGE